MKLTASKIFVLLFVVVSSVSIFAQNSEMDPNAAKAYNEGNKFLNSGNYEGAIKQYDEALKISKDYRIYYQKGIALKKEGKFADAEDAFNASIKDNPKFDVGYNGLGSTYFVDGKYLEAAEAFKKFGELTTKKSFKDKALENAARAYTKLGENTKKDGNYKKAEEYLNEAVKASPDFDAAYVALASLYVENSEFDKAVTAAAAVINMKSSKLKGAAYYYSLAYKGKEDKEKAKENFELAKKDPQYKNNSEYELKMLNR